MGELLPCPFCNAQPVPLSQLKAYEQSTAGRFRCENTADDCPIAGLTMTSSEWNTRPRTEGPGEGESQVDDLAMLVRMLVQHVPETQQIHGRALDYLARHGLTGSPLRASPIREPEISREALGEAIYLALYEHQGAVWAANESKGVWYDAADRLRAILNLAPVGGRGEGWRPISEAPRDGSYILAHVADRDADDRWAHLAGRAFVVRHEGKTSSGYDLGWSVHPGFGGCSDDWFSGWQPLPPLPEEQGGMK